MHGRVTKSKSVAKLSVTTEAQGQSQTIPYGICGGQSGAGTGFFLHTSVF